MRLIPLVALILLAACSSKPVSPPVTTAQMPPDWSGVWIAGGIEMNLDGYTPANQDSNAVTRPPLFIFNSQIPWNDTARARVQAILAESHGEPGNRADGAQGWGYPLMMVGPAALQFVNTAGLTIIMNLYRDARQVYTDGRGHRPTEEAWPATTWGDSIGHWEGDTLVIDTLLVRDPNLFFGIASPFSSKAHYVERLRLTAPGRIEGEMIVEDPETLTAPVKVPLTFVRSQEIERMVFDSFSNDRSGFDGEFNTIEAAGK